MRGPGPSLRSAHSARPQSRSLLHRAHRRAGNPWSLGPNRTGAAVESLHGRVDGGRPDSLPPNCITRRSRLGLHVYRLGNAAADGHRDQAGSSAQRSRGACRRRSRKIHRADHGRAKRERAKTRHPDRLARPVAEHTPLPAGSDGVLAWCRRSAGVQPFGSHANGQLRVADGAGAQGNHHAAVGDGVAPGGRAVSPGARQHRSARATQRAPATLRWRHATARCRSPAPGGERSHVHDVRLQ